ncbi:hypothetical protein Zm00014a_003934 [Zea mays]|uniref:Uncharacterized protein n=2 Tax=Zea mays TaxID=4577 RepID=A0A1D6K9G6_MAIZE|nr:hypothetical protein ZEAMMB73_Zm00001d030075 [Zea mays]ONM00133.1 hypothetical protein ZEAMMB73_Zm00001d030075 [Zea mays]ONM00134.1 hypothetical protein ZEAMMB73_Zm00001d030075 [Zea mays]PWZ55482.1 hypothetical protein Zm00014a_003934 [Zea mays]
MAKFLSHEKGIPICRLVSKQTKKSLATAIVPEGVYFDKHLRDALIKGLQRQIDMISQFKELKDQRWSDLQVASWPLKEIETGYAKQTYRMTCHTLGKNGCYITIFRPKQEKRVSVIHCEKEVDTESPSDVEILDTQQILRRGNYSMCLMIAK